MPLTFAHPAAVLALARLRLPVSALVVGSVAPDLVYFARLTPRGHFGHTFPGLFLFCLPAGFALLWLFDCVLKHALVELLPVAAQRRLVPRIAASPFDRSLLPVALGVVIGAVTHDVWDAFTHVGGWGVDAIPTLRSPVQLSRLGPVPLYKLVQHGSTLIGLGALAATTAFWWRDAPEVEVRPHLTARTRAIRLGLLISISFAAGASYAGAVASGTVSPLPVFVGHFVVSATSAAFAVATMYSAWHRSRSSSAG